MTEEKRIILARRAQLIAAALAGAGLGAGAQSCTADQRSGVNPESPRQPVTEIIVPGSDASGTEPEATDEDGGLPGRTPTPEPTPPPRPTRPQICLSEY
ncbi:MAG: hypothetical protein IPI67_06375 [Myxococcales bacterium]|nr:hypothetical protein [Myxococcales bacterium]